jgi:hypothetical protein
MMPLHPEFAGVEQLLALFGGQGAQHSIRRIGEQGQVLTEIGGEWLLEVLLQEALPIILP